MASYPDIYYWEPMAKLPDGVRLATVDDLNRPKSELIGVRFYTKVNASRKQCLACTINKYTKGLGAFLKRNLLWVDDPLQVMTTTNPHVKQYL